MSGTECTKQLELFEVGRSRSRSLSKNVSRLGLGTRCRAEVAEAGGVSPGQAIWARNAFSRL